MKRTYPQRRDDGTLAINQPSVNGWDIFYNPDDGRWYVAHRVQKVELEFVGDYADRWHALRYAKTHTP
jgi:hypothetical protein